MPVEVVSQKPDAGRNRAANKAGSHKPAVHDPSGERCSTRENKLPAACRRWARFDSPLRARPFDFLSSVDDRCV